MSNLRVYDNYVETFSNQNEMLKYFIDQTKRSEWIPATTKELLVKPLYNGPIFASYVREENKLDVSEEAIIDTMENGRLMIDRKVGCTSTTYLVRNIVFEQLIERADVRDNAPRNLFRANRLNDLCTMVNLGLDSKEQKMLILVRDEKITAMNGSHYAILPTDQLIEALLRQLDVRFAGYVFKHGIVEHSGMYADWELPNQAHELLGKYSRELAAANHPLKGAEMIPSIRMYTSDVRMNAATISARITGKNFELPIGNALKVNHRLGNTVDKFEEQCGLLYAKFTDQVAKLRALMKVRVNYPIDAIMNACKEIGIPKKYATSAADTYERVFGAGSSTAHDVFWGINEVLAVMKSNGESEIAILTMEENIARALLLDWEKIDCPIDDYKGGVAA